MAFQLFGLHEGAATQQPFLHSPLPAERALHTWAMPHFSQEQDQRLVSLITSQVHPKKKNLEINQEERGAMAVLALRAAAALRPGQTQSLSCRRAPRVCVPRT